MDFETPSPTDAPRRRPLVFPVAGLLAGLIFHRWALQTAIAFPVALLAALLVLHVAGRRHLFWTLVGFALFFAVGLARAHVDGMSRHRSDLARLEDGDPMPIRLRGKVVEIEPERPGRNTPVETLFLADVSQVLVRDRWESLNGRVRVKIPTEDLDVWRNDRIEFLGVLYDLPEQANPGQYDTGARLRARGIDRIVSIPGKECLTVRDRPGRGLAGRIETMRNDLSRTIRRRLPKREGALLSAMLLGDQRQLQTEAREHFARSGTVHLLAVSGLHLMLVVSGLFMVLRLVRTPPRMAAVLLILFVWAFTVLTGSKTPVTRAALMTTVYFVADLIGRERDSWNALALAAGILALARPADVFTPGFQLSFAAVSGILAFSRPIASALISEERLVLALSKDPSDRARARASSWIGLSVAVSTAAWIATAPLVLVHFNLATPIVPLANLVAAPLTAVLLAAGFLALPFLALGTAIPAWPACALAWLLEETARFFSDLPFSHHYVIAPSGVRLGLAYVLFAAAAYRPWKRYWNAGLFFSALIAGIIITFFPADGRPPKNLEMTVLDVGQGCSVVCRFPDGRTLLYDTGTVGTWDVGRFITAPFLWKQNVSKIDLLVISHADLDHISGIEAILERFPVNQAAVPRDFGNSLAGFHVLTLFRDRGIPVNRLHRGSPSLPGWAGVVDVLHPPEPGRCPILTRNNGSLTLSVSHGRHRILLPGDLERTGLDMMNRELDRGVFDVILAPHHGSDEVEGNTPLARQRPSVVLMSCSRRFEVSATAALYCDHGARVYRTWQSGAITVEIPTEGEITASCFRKKAGTSCNGEDK